MGTRLFHRVPRGAELTAAGEAFLATVRIMPGMVADAIRAAQRAGRGESGILRVGFTGSAMLKLIVPGTIRTFRRRYAAVELVMSENNSTGLAHAWRDDGLDVAFLRPGAIDGADRLGSVADPLLSAWKLSGQALGINALFDEGNRMIDYVRLTNDSVSDRSDEQVGRFQDRTKSGRTDWTSAGELGSTSNGSLINGVINFPTELR